MFDAVNPVYDSPRGSSESCEALPDTGGPINRIAIAASAAYFDSISWPCKRSSMRPKPCRSMHTSSGSPCSVRFAELSEFKDFMRTARFLDIGSGMAGRTSADRTATTSHVISQLEHASARVSSASRGTLRVPVERGAYGREIEPHHRDRHRPGQGRHHRRRLDRAGGRRANIVDISQTTLREFFTMIMMADMEKAAVPFDELKRRLNTKGEQMGLQDRRAARRRVQVHAPDLASGA